MLYNKIAWKLKIRKCNIRLKKRYRLFLAFILIFIFYCEFLVYYLQTSKWSELKCEKDMTCTRVLFVADPQIIGMLNEPKWYGPISRWDCARYLGKTYKIAFNFFRPDIVIFLGDLFDEGYISTMDDFEGYVNTFQQIFPPNDYMKFIYTYGDNDIGQGSSRLRDLYNSFFNKNETYVHYYNNLEIVDFSLVQDTFKLTYHTRILIAHDISDALVEQIISKYTPSIQPAVIFTGHTHNSTLRNFVVENTGYVKHTRELMGYNIYRGSLYDIHCINVPTCSYRMGVPKIGFGAATFVPNEVHFNYTILWSPSRFPTLRIYGIFAVMVFIIVVIFYVLPSLHINVFRKINDLLLL